MPLTTLVYISVAAKDLSENELAEILQKARENNQKIDVTGMLLYRKGFFIQALEGEDELVMPLYEKIKNDERHGNILQIYKSPINKRNFEDWSMGFHYIENKDLASLEGFTDVLEKPFTSDFFRKNPSHAQTLLDSFRQRNSNRL